MLGIVDDGGRERLFVHQKRYRRWRAIAQAGVSCHEVSEVPRGTRPRRGCTAVVNAALLTVVFFTVNFKGLDRLVQWPS